ncbi:serine protease inhibitor A3L-like [Paramormyrops kingsleyae]|uniref:Thyroxine-binding globulin n=1 Tax=Paramormyrops kingsleyae TaxID=1676925 RepID=A0A3B3R1S6_9TELE|nr:serine protease inhibitor A3L-like [Paramormyrops kingsleyae]
MRLLLGFCIALVVLHFPVQGDHHGDHGAHGKGHGGHSHEKGHKHEHGHHRHEKHVNGSLRIYLQNGGFAFDLYKHMTAQPDLQSKNVFFSPLSLSLALAALSVGAEGETHRQLFDGLGFNGTDITPEEVNDAFHDILMNLNQKKATDLSVGSAVFLDDDFKPRPEFLEALKRFYHSEGFTTDFTKSAEARQAVNNYVKDKTHGKIAELVDSVEPSTLMILISYVYFKGKWDIPFDPASTEDSVFHVNETHDVPVKMMTESNSFYIYHDEEHSTSVLQLLYNESMSMMLILPEKGLEALEKVFDGKLVTKWRRSLRKMPYKVSIPKFSIKTSYSLKEVIAEMGITDIFSQTANFKGISDDQLSVSKVLQKATLDVDEEGSTATAATSVHLIRTSGLVPPDTLRFDRPFVVIIANRDTRSILFMGKIVNPTK